MFINLIFLIIEPNIRKSALSSFILIYRSVTMIPSMQEDSSRSPSYTVSCEDYVHVVEFSPFSSGTPASLLAYGGNQYVVVGTCLFPVRDAASHYLVYLKNHLAYSFLNMCFSCRRRTWRSRELYLMFFELSIMNCVLMLSPGAPSPGWTGYPLSGTGPWSADIMSPINLYVAGRHGSVCLCVS